MHVYHPEFIMTHLIMKYAQYSLEFKVQTVINYLQLTEKISLRKFCREHSVSINTFKNWLKKYKEETLTIDLRKYKHRPYVITESFKKAIDEMMKTNGLLSILRIRANMIADFPYSLSTYYSVIHQMNFTYKQVSTYTLPKKKDIN